MRILRLHYAVLRAELTVTLWLYLSVQIVALHDIPDLNILDFLPEFLDGLFCILNDPNAEIRRSCELVLSRLLEDIVANASTVNFAKMINIVVIHCGEEVAGVATDDCVRETALRWLRQFVLLAGRSSECHS